MGRGVAWQGRWICRWKPLRAFYATESQAHRLRREVICLAASWLQNPASKGDWIGLANLSTNSVRNNKRRLCRLQVIVETRVISSIAIAWSL